MLLSELFRSTDINIPAELADTDIDHIAYDSRLAASGTLFVCLVGNLSDGHRYATDAYSRGCRAFLCERGLDLPPDAAVIVTDDTSVALALISAEFYGRPADKLSIIGITGTRGKTSTALYIYDILTASGMRTGYIGGVGVMFGGMRTSSLRVFPESTDLHLYFRKMLAAGVTTVVLEVSSEDLYRNRVHGIKFSSCVFTNLAHAHIGKYEHPTFDHYAKSKARLFRDFGCDFIAYNKDDAYAERILGGVTAEKASVSVCGDADYVAYSIEKRRHGGDIGIDFTCRKDGENARIRLSTVGEFSVTNALLAIAVCEHHGLPIDAITSAIERVTPTGRFEVIDALPYASFVIDYAYDAPHLRDALAILRGYAPSRLIVLVGSVGGRTYSRRAPIGKAISELADLCILTSDDPDFEDPMTIISDILVGFGESETPYVCIPDRREAIEYAVREAREGDIILLAGKGHENFQLISGEHMLFSERSIFREASERILMKKSRLPSVAHSEF